MFAEHTTFYGRRIESGKRGFETVKAIFSSCHGDPTTQHDLTKQEPGPEHNQPLAQVCVYQTNSSVSQYARSRPRNDPCCVGGTAVAHPQKYDCTEQSS